MTATPQPATKIYRHAGVSFTPGTGIVHFRVPGGEKDVIQRRWGALLRARGLAGEPVLRRGEDEAIHGYSNVYTFLPLFPIRRVIEAGWEPGDPRDAGLAAELDLHVFDSQMYSRSYELYYRIAQFRGWVAMPVQLGRQPSLFLGTGRFSRLLSMNADESVAAPLAFAGADKAYCRGLLKSHGFPVAAGAVAATAAEAARQGTELGFPVALKRSQGAGNSEGVILGIDTESDCIEAARELLAGGQLLVVERMVAGVELRLHFIRGRLFRVLRSEARTVTGDGVTSFSGLLTRDHPEYFATMSGTGHHRRRMVLQLYHAGVREFADLARVRPKAREVVRVSAAAGGDATTRLATDVLHEADRLALEAFLARYGAPSAGIDIILRKPGARLADGGAILEINVPCGFGYLGDEAARAADLEVLDTARRCPGFIAAGGRVPLELAVDDEFPSGSSEREALVGRFAEEYPEGRVFSLSGSGGWLPILTDAGASAFLVFVDEAAVAEHGMPVNLKPAVRRARGRPEFEALYPIVCATSLNAGGSLQGDNADR